MPSPVQGIFCIILVVAAAFFTAFSIRFLKLYKKYKKAEEIAAPEEKQPDAKIYYIKERLNKPRARRTRKKPQIALSGIVIRPEQFKKMMRDHTDNAK